MSLERGCKRLLIIGSHPLACDSSSKAVHALSQGLALAHDWTVTVFTDAPPARVVDKERHRQICERVRVVESCHSLESTVARVVPDVVLVHGSMHRIRTVMAEASKYTPTLVAYIDLDYTGMLPPHIELLNRCACVVTCSPAWARHVVSVGVTVPCHTVPYAVDPCLVYPVPQQLARRVHGLPEDNFVALHMAKNDVRMRWDICMMAWAKVVLEYRTSKTGKFPVLLVVADMTGAWDLAFVYDAALTAAGIPFEEGLAHLVHVDAADRLSDYHVNVLYNAADVGICVADGEGVGLCAKEMSSVGRAVVASAVVGHIDSLRPDAACIIPPCFEYAVESGREGSGGTATPVSAWDVAKELIRLRHDESLTASLGRAGAYHGSITWVGPCAEFASILGRFAPPKMRSER